ncbi:MAG: EthD family reductase [Deltaproteobacteria bacterium]|nr:EthD family reductase [Deltaproteobacteria bacterium]
MFKVSVMYPNEKGAKFDFDYYRNQHMALVQKHMKPFGLVKTGVDKGLSGGGDTPPPYICVGHLYFETRDGYEKGAAQCGPILRGDVPNFTTVTPIRLISEILY